jgi:hypothetical protein
LVQRGLAPDALGELGERTDQQKCRTVNPTGCANHFATVGDDAK